jgi:molybdopterin-guanine dinucleotide biosynthesis protein MobB
LKTVIVGVVGGKKSGKTTTIEVLTRELSKRGYQVAVAKHIPEANFTIDTKGKDTWRFAQAGAKTVIAASAKEFAIIKRTFGELSLEKILQSCSSVDIVFLEGFRKLVSQKKSVYKIVIAKSAREVEEAVEVFDPIIAFTGSYRPKKVETKIPYVEVLKNGEKMADLVEKLARKKP